MRKVLILKNWDYPDLLRQTHNSEGYWDDFQFIIDPVEKHLSNFDYAIILNHSAKEYTLECNPDHVWAIMQEPPNEFFGPRQRIEKHFSRVYTTNSDLKGRGYISSQPALPWHVNKNYDLLKNITCPSKEKICSWITSDISSFKGHQDRLSFLSKIRKNVEFDLYGRGHQFIDDKWDGLGPYRYSIAIENFHNPLYWSEKIADCFLSWTFPIYYGCTHLDNYFPKEAFIEIDINDDRSIELINETIHSNLWKNNFEAINYARELILEKYQLFPFISNEINIYELSEKNKKNSQSIRVPNFYSYKPKERKIINLAIFIKKKIAQTIRIMIKKFCGKS